MHGVINSNMDHPMLCACLWNSTLNVTSCNIWWVQWNGYRRRRHRSHKVFVIGSLIDKVNVKATVENELLLSASTQSKMNSYHFTTSFYSERNKAEMMKSAKTADKRQASRRDATCVVKEWQWQTANRGEREKGLSFKAQEWNLFAEHWGDVVETVTDAACAGPWSVTTGLKYCVNTPNMLTDTCI